MESRLASAAFVVVFAIYLFLGGMGLTERNIANPRDDAYNCLARGLLSGHLYAAKEAPAGLAALKDPYDPKANETFRTDISYMVHDYSYYQGRLYLYFGVAPAIFVFIPWHLLTGGWLPQWAAVALLCAAGLAVNLSLLRSVMRDSLPPAPKWMLAACVLILGLGSYAPLLLARADMWEVPIAFSYLGISLALRFLWTAFCRPERSAKWIALASLSVGLAFAARPNVLPLGALLFFPFALPELRRRLSAWVAAFLPVGVCGLLVALYNQMRFGSPFEFGQRFQLATEYVSRMKLFSPEYLTDNLYLFLLQPVDWRRYFPYASEPRYTLVSKNHGMIEHLSGALLNDPVLWAGLALFVFIVVRKPARRFCLIALAAGWAFVGSLLLMSLFFGVCSRYQFEFVPPLALLASLGVLCLESALSGSRLLLARAVWMSGLLFSSAFTVLYGLDRSVHDHSTAAIILTSKGDLRDADREVRILKVLAPTDPQIKVYSGVIQMAAGHVVVAEQEFAEIVRNNPDYVLGHYDLSRAYIAEGRLADAVAELKEAHRLAPGSQLVDAALQFAADKQAHARTP